MFVLYETPAGYSLFKVQDNKRFDETDTDEIYDEFFSSDDGARKALEMVSFEAFDGTANAVAAATASMEGKITPTLQSFLKKQLKQHTSKKSSPMLAVADKALAVNLKQESKLPSSLQIVHNDKTNEVFRGIRRHLDELLDDGAEDGGVSAKDMRAMQLGLSHALSRYKLKFSADKVDTMVIQAVGLLDELDKEINTYAMRVKEWYGWHFPELQGIAGDNAQYSKLVLECGIRANYADKDLSSILEDESLQAAVKEAAEVSMGTEIADVDTINIQSLAEQVLSMTEYRAQLFEYLKNRMNAIAPNLTIMVGELVGARLISHAGSLMNLAKQPASTVQILGAEKALFRALKTKHDTPKYGLIYHASLIGQASPKNKGKISRVLAAKAALAIRVDALSDDTQVDEDDDDGGVGVDTTIGFEGRAKVEARLRQLEGQGFVPTSSTWTASKTAKYDPVAAKTATATPTYNTASDMVLDVQDGEADAQDDDDEDKKKKKKAKKEKRKSKGGDGEDEDDEPPKKKSKKEKKTDEDEEKTPSKKKKSKKDKSQDSSSSDDEEPKSSSKKKKSKKSSDDDDDDDEAETSAKKKSKKEKKRKSDASDASKKEKKKNAGDDDDDEAARKAAKKAKKKAKKSI